MSSQTSLDNNSDIGPLNDYLGHLEAEKGFSLSTVRAYGTDLKDFQIWLQTFRQATLASPELITREHIKGYAAELHRRKVARTTVARKLASLRGFFRYAIRKGLLEKNPVLSLPNPKTEKRHPKSLNVEQTALLLDGKAEGDPKRIRNLALAELLYGSGLRISEALGLDIHDVDLGAGIARVMGKGGKERLAPMTGTSIDRLKAYLQIRTFFSKNIQEGALFLGERGNRLNRRTAYKIIEDLSVERGLPERLNPHGLRHAFASHMLESGLDLRSVQELLGHARIVTTQRYTHLDLQHVISVYDKAHPKSQTSDKKDEE